MSSLEKQDKIREYRRLYYHRKKEKFRRKVKCEVCGKHITKDNFTRHKRSKLHQRNLAASTNKEEEKPKKEKVKKEQPVKVIQVKPTETSRSETKDARSANIYKFEINLTV